jgi:phosphate transport system substrate-binding protein
MKFVAAALIIALAGFPCTPRAQQITGAGATFPAPLYAAWGKAAEAAIGVKLNYQAFSSGTGSSQVLNRTVDFGASDEPINPERLESGNLLQFPTVTGAIVVVVNIPGVEPNQLKLTGEIIADIYLGKIIRWNDTRIVEINPNLRLPNLAVVPIFRAGSSGTNFVFTSYLSTVDPAWSQRVGFGTSVKWPAGSGTRGNSGVVLTVSRVSGAVGYLQSAFAARSHLATAELRNKAGKFVEPSRDSFSAATASADWRSAPNFGVNLIDQGGDRTWPIVAATFVLLPKDPRDPTSSANVIKLFDWAYAHGGAMAEEMEYSPVPVEVQDAVRQAWRIEVKGPAGKPVF